MTHSTRSPHKPRSLLLPVGTAALAAAIFIVDLVTRTEYETAAFYAAVVLLSARFLAARGVVLTAAACAGLTLLSGALSHLSGPEAAEDVINALISIAVIGGTMLLALQSQAGEMRLRESEEQWKAVFEHNPTMYFMVDAAGLTLSVNPFGAEQLGYTVEELVGRPVENLFHETDREAARRNTATCLEHIGQTATWELRKVRKSGEVIWVRETASAMLIRQRPIVLIVCEDITERKKAESLTGLVFESSPDGMCIVGSDYRYQRVNPVYGRIWRRPAETLIGERVADLLGSELFEQTSKPSLDRCFAGEDVSFTGWFDYSSRRRYLSVSYSPLRVSSDSVDAALVITRDLTEQALAGEALREAQAALAHVNRVATMGQLTASIAHEVSQPTAAVILNAKAALRWLDNDPPDPGEARQAISRIVENGGRVVDVISRIRAVIKKAPPQNARFDLNEAVRDVIGLTRSEAEKHGVSVQARLGADLSPVEGDRVQIQQVVLNLIINAIEAMRDAKNGLRELQLSTEADAEGGVRLAVRDSGPGLEPGDLGRLFEAFYTTKREGMGMGLAICRSIIEAHGGRLWASANEPRGAMFQFVLPAKRRTRQVARKRAAARA